MIKVDEKELIRRAYLLEGQSERQIAEAQKHSRHSVAAVIAGSQTATYRMSQPRAAPVMDAVKAIVDSWLVADQTAPRKQRHTAHRIFERLVTEQGFKGKEPTVRRFVRLRATSALGSVDRGY